MTNKSPQHLPDIQSQLSTLDLFDAFKKQLSKDFAQSNFSVDFIKNLQPNYDTLLERIALELQRNERSTDLMKLVNRIDISEAQMTRYLSENKNKDYFRVMAELIIKRVLQKVVIRKYYKSND